MSRGGTWDDDPQAIGLRTLLAKSCSECFELRDANEFFKKKNGYWQSRCRYCSSKKAIDYAHRHNREALDHATHHYAPWSQKEKDHLWVMYNVDYTYTEMAEVLGRSWKAVSNMLEKLRIEE